MSASAALDPATGRILGYVAPKGRDPGRIAVLIDGAVVARRIAVSSVEALGDASVDPPPTATCAFALRLPTETRGRSLEVRSDNGAALLTAVFESDEALARYREGSVMADSIRIERLRLTDGRFRGVVTDADGGEPAEVSILVRGEIVATTTSEAGPDGIQRFDAPAPAEALSDGVRMVEFALADGSVAARYAMAYGDALDGDLEAEVASLRAEIDQLKRAFREAMAGGVLARDERPLIVAEALVEVDNLLALRDRADAAAALQHEEDWDEAAAAWELDE